MGNLGQRAGNELSPPSVTKTEDRAVVARESFGYLATAPSYGSLAASVCRPFEVVISVFVCERFGVFHQTLPYTVGSTPHTRTPSPLAESTAFHDVLTFSPFFPIVPTSPSPPAESLPYQRKNRVTVFKCPYVVVFWYWLQSH